MNRKRFDAYPTETAVTRALLNRVPISGIVCEPCAGAGLMAGELQKETAVSSVRTNDIDVEQYARYGRHDFFGDATDPLADVWSYPIADFQRPFSWIVTNPPFNQAMGVLRQSWEHASVGVAFLLRLTFLEPAGKRSGERGEWLAAHEDQMTHLITLGQPRPSFTGNGKTDSATVAWMVWQKDWSWDRMGIERPFQFAMKWKL